MEWMPIESAPKDGTTLILYGPWAGEIAGKTENLVIDIGYWAGGESDFDGDDWWALQTGDAYACWIRATHYMPLPQPPKESA